LLFESNKTPIELCDEVCSPGGSTIEGVNLMKDNNFVKIVEMACEATFNKNNKMK
ncbi:MAG: pyrroline-5-carboxylate reductase, partial [Bacilli bacterium]|nr:pyrroline-5-carboxylate reductase [Bacilli bacterium]